MKNLQYFFLSVALTFFIGANYSISQPTTWCDDGCESSIPWQNATLTKSPTGCPSCTVHVDYRYRNGTCNGNDVRELNILNMSFINCYNCNYQGFADTKGRYVYGMTLILKYHNWDSNGIGGPFQVKMKNWPCMTRTLEGIYKNYTVCWTTNYCCKYIYTLISETGLPPYQITHSDSLPGTSYCHGGGLECISQIPNDTNYCAICVCDTFANEQPLIINTFNEKNNDVFINKISFNQDNQTLDIFHQANGNSKIYIYDLFGRLIYYNQFYKDSKNFRLNFQKSLTFGFYNYKIEIEDIFVIGKFIIY